MTNEDEIIDDLETDDKFNLETEELCINNLFQELLEEPTDEGKNSDYYLAEIKITIIGDTYNLILDSGSEVNVINKNIIDKIQNNPLNREKLRILPTNNINLIGATGRKHKTVDKQVLIDLNINNLILPTVFLIVKELNVDILVGCEFLKGTKAILNFNDETITINEQVIHFIKKSTSKCNNIFNLKVDKKESFDEIWEKQINNIRETLSNEDPRIVNELINTFNNYQHLFSNVPGLAKDYTCKIKFKPELKLIKKSYPIPYNQRIAVKKEIDKMIEQDIIEPSSSQYINPIVVVQKESGEVRLCLDGRELNKFIIRDFTEPETIDNILMRFNGCKYITSFDLTSGFFQVPLDKDSREFVSFNLFGRMYQFKRVPFGLSISSSEFIKCLYQVLGEEILEWAIIYIDDLAICSKTLEEHVCRLNLLFKKLFEGNLTLKLEKSKFITGELKYLGYVINSEGIKVNQEKTKAILEFPEPKNLKQLQSFLGICNFYRKFHKNYSDLTAKLKHILSKKNKFIWGEKERETFREIKERFINCVMLKHPDFSRDFVMSTDASDIGLGVELFQEDGEGNHLVVAYASRGLTKAELNYTICEKECLSVLFGLQKLRGYFGGNHVIIRTDHKALIFLKSCKLGSGRLARWTLALQNFNISWEYIPGKENIVADIISRTDYEGNVETRNQNEFRILNILREDKFVVAIVNKIKEEQKIDQTVIKIKSKLENGDVNICKYYIIHDEILFCKKNDKNQFFKIYIPDSCANELINEYHLRLGHVGISKMNMYLNQFCYIRDCKRKLAKVLKFCKYCQFVKGVNLSKNIEMNTIVSRYKGHKVFIDIYGELPGGQFKWLLIILDGYSKFVKLYPIKKCNANSVVRKVRDYVKNYGPIEFIISDNGPCFRSRIWKEGMTQLNIKYRYISIIHPQANLSERCLKEVGRILRTYIPESKHNIWYKYIDHAEFIINNNFHQTTEYIPEEVRTNKKLNDIIYKLIKFPQTLQLDNPEKINKNILARVENKSKNRNKNRNKQHIKYNLNDPVLIKNIALSSKVKKISAKLCKKWKGPFTIEQSLGKNCYLIKDNKGKMYKVNAKLMKPYYVQCL